MPRIEIPEEYEPIIDHLADAKDALDALESSRTVALARTSLQQALLWLMSPSIADALERDGLDEAETGDAGDESADEGDSADA